MLNTENQSIEQVFLLYEQMDHHDIYCAGNGSNHWANGDSGILDQGCSKTKAGGIHP
jgi:hypothetical protein